MRPWLLLVLAVTSVGCTNDYGEFRIPKGAVAVTATTPDGAPDAGSNASSDAAPDGD